MDSLNSLIEADLFSVTVSSDTMSARIEIVDKQKTGWIIRAEGVDDLLVTDVRLSNIIDRVVFVDSLTDQTREIAEKIFLLMRGKLAEGDELEWKPLRQKLEAISAGKLGTCQELGTCQALVIVLSGRLPPHDGGMNPSPPDLG